MDRHFTAMIVDDEPEAIYYLRNLVSENFPDVRIVATAQSSGEAIHNYFEHLPELLFLDIHLGDTDGFSILKDLFSHHAKPYVIFITAFDKYAIQAFKHDALDYLLKPLKIEDLSRGIQKFIQQRGKDDQALRVSEFISQYQRRLRFNTREGFILLDAKDILYFEAERNYTKVLMISGKTETISTNIGSLEEKIPASIFKRISKTHIINIDYLYKAGRKKKTVQLIFNGKEQILPASGGRLFGFEE